MAPRFFLACLGLIATTASAQFQSLVVEEVDNRGTVPGKTYRIYAQMEAEGDVIDAVFGDEKIFTEVKSTAPFFQHPQGVIAATSCSVPWCRAPRMDCSTTAG